MKQALYVTVLIAGLLLALWGLSLLSSKERGVNLLYNQDDAFSSDETIANGEGTNSQTMPETTTQGSTGDVTTVVMKTNKGDVTLELFSGLMPITAGNFIKLAQANFFDGIKFHRVIDGFMIQGGDPLTKDDSKKAMWGTGGPGFAIADEHIANPMLSNTRGTISMANSGPNSGGSQFFINVADNTNLDFDKQPLSSKHPVFGRVVKGMEVVDAIAGSATDPRDAPLEAVVINDIVVQG